MKSIYTDSIKTPCFTRFMITLCSIILPALSFAQTEKTVQHHVDRLRLVNDMPYICRADSDSSGMPGCGSKYFWNVVKLKEKAIPYLIAKISDDTRTKAPVPNFGGFYAVGDIAYDALQEIVRGIPTFQLLGVTFDSEGCGYCAYWQQVRKSAANRKAFMHAVRQWYNTNEAKLVWTASDDVSICDCSFKNPNGGHYELKSK